MFLICWFFYAGSYSLWHEANPINETHQYVFRIRIIKIIGLDCAMLLLVLYIFTLFSVANFGQGTVLGTQWLTSIIWIFKEVKTKEISVCWPSVVFLLIEETFHWCDSAIQLDVTQLFESCMLHFPVGWALANERSSVYKN